MAYRYLRDEARTSSGQMIPLELIDIITSYLNDSSKTQQQQASVNYFIGKLQKSKLIAEDVVRAKKEHTIRPKCATGNICDFRIINFTSLDRLEAYGWYRERKSLCSWFVREYGKFQKKPII